MSGKGELKVEENELDSDEEKSDSETSGEAEEIATKTMEDVAADVRELTKRIGADLARTYASSTEAVNKRLQMGVLNDAMAKQGALNGLVGADMIATSLDNLAKTMGEINAKGDQVPFYSRWKFYAFVCGIAIPTTSALVAICTYVANLNKSGSTIINVPPSSNTPELTDEQKLAVKKRIEAWLAKDDVGFWNSMADYVAYDNFNPALETQIQFMKLMQEVLLAGGGTKPEWPNDSASWIAEKRDMLIELFTKSTTPRKERQTSEIFRKVATLKGNFGGIDQPVPRYLAADLCALVLADLIVWIRGHPA